MEENRASPPRDERMSVRLVDALTRVWTRIRRRHPGVPPVVILAAPASREQRNILGHFAALRWTGKRSGEAMIHEVVVIAEHLNRPANEVVATLLHEAAHSINFERKIHDCSSTSQYHNKHFQVAAEELGLNVQHVPNYGYALTTLPLETAKTYRAEIDALESVLLHRRAFMVRRPTNGDGDGSDGRDDAEEGPRSRMRKATCACGFIIRLSMKTYTDTTICCQRCGESFRLA